MNRSLIIAFFIAIALVVALSYVAATLFTM